MSRFLRAKQILDVDSEALISLDLVFALEETGATVLVAPNAARVRDILALRRVSAAVIDPPASDGNPAALPRFSAKTKQNLAGDVL